MRSAILATLAGLALMGACSAIRTAEDSARESQALGGRAAAIERAVSAGPPAAD